MERRSFLTLVGAAMVPACSVVQGPTGPIVTINVAQIDLWGKAIVAAGTLAAGEAGPAAPVIASALATAGGAIAAFDAATQGQVSISINTTSVMTEVKSVLDAGLGIEPAVNKAFGGAVPPTVSNEMLALETILDLFSAALAAPGTAPVSLAAPKMTEAQALGVLNVR